MTTNEKTYKITLQGETGKYGPIEHELNIPEETLKDLEKQVKEHLKDIAFSKTLAGKLARDLAEVWDAGDWDKMPNIARRGYLHRAAKLIDELGWTNPVLTAESVRRELNEVAEEYAAEVRDGYPKPRERRFDLLVDGKLVTSYTEVSGPAAASKVVAGRGPRLTLNGEEIEAIRTLHDAAQHALDHVALSPVRAHNTEQAIKILKRFQP